MVDGKKGGWELGREEWRVGGGTNEWRVGGREE